MRSNLFAGLVIFSAGMTVGSILQWLQDHKTIETQRHNYDKLADSYNEKMQSSYPQSQILKLLVF